MKKLYNLTTTWGTTEKVYVRKDTYLMDGTLAVQLICEDSIPYATITRHVEVKPSKKNCAFIKSYSENAGIEEFLLANKIATPTGRTYTSGFVVLPEYEFDLSKLEK